MSSDNSAQKWIIGCLAAGFVAVLLCGGLVAGLAFLGYRAARQVAQEIGPEIASHAELAAMGKMWVPPSAQAGPDDVFPTSVTATIRPRPGQPLPQTIAAWNRTTHDDSAAIPELALDQNGRHARYEANGAVIDVYLYQVTRADQAQVFGNAVSAIQAAGYSSQTQDDFNFDDVHWMTFSFVPPQRYGRMWWAKDWLIVTITDKPEVNLEEFEHAYLLYIQGKGVADASSENPSERPTLDGDDAAPNAGKE